MTQAIAEVANARTQKQLHLAINALYDCGIMRDRDYESIYKSSDTFIDTRDGRTFNVDSLLEDTMAAYINDATKPADLLNLRRAKTPDVMIAGTPSLIAHEVANYINQAIYASEIPDAFQEYLQIPHPRRRTRPKRVCHRDWLRQLRRNRRHPGPLAHSPASQLHRCAAVARTSTPIRNRPAGYRRHGKSLVHSSRLRSHPGPMPVGGANPLRPKLQHQPRTTEDGHPTRPTVWTVADCQASKA